MKSRVTKDLRDLLAGLPEHIQRQAEDAYALFRQDPNHPSLRFKPIKGRPTYYSARVGLRYRVLDYKGGDGVVWLWIGTHAEYDMLISQL